MSGGRGAGALAPHLTDELLDGVVSHLIQRLEAPGNRAEAARTYMHSLAAIRPAPAPPACSASPSVSRIWSTT